MQPYSLLESVRLPTSSEVGLRCRLQRTLPPTPARPRRVLVLRDGRVWPAQATKMLRDEGYKVSFCDTREAALGSSLVAQPDLILLPVGWRELCQQMRALDPAGTRALVAYGDGSDEEGRVVSAMEDDADDYVIDPTRLQELRVRIRAQMRHVRDREVLQWAHMQRSSMRDLAETDPLTGVGNRRALGAMLEQAVQQDAAVTFVLIDLDHFKDVNDAHGHPFGDMVLQCVASALTQAAPEGAVVARWGGEEFAVAYRGEVEEGPEELGERLRCAVKSVTMPDSDVVVSASVGVAHDSVQRRCWSSAQFIQVADEALYESKRDGRDRVTVGGFEHV